MADVLTIVAVVEWMALGVLLLRKMKYWNRVMQTLYDALKEDEEEKNG